MLETLRSSTFRLRMPNRCSVGLRSGDMLGQSITFTLSFFSKAVVVFEVCLRSSLKYCPAAQFLKKGDPALLQYVTVHVGIHGSCVFWLPGVHFTHIFQQFFKKNFNNCWKTRVKVSPLVHTTAHTSIFQRQPLDMTLSMCTQLLWPIIAKPVLSGTCHVKPAQFQGVGNVLVT